MVLKFIDTKFVLKNYFFKEFLKYSLKSALYFYIKSTNGCDLSPRKIFAIFRNFYDFYRILHKLSFLKSVPCDLSHF